MDNNHKELKQQEKTLKKHISKDFNELSKNYLYKLNQIMELTSDEEALYILNLTLQVLQKRFG